MTTRRTAHTARMFALPGRFAFRLVAWRSAVIGGLAICSLGACSLSDLVGQSEVPAGTADPAAVVTEAGAMGLYVSALQRFREAVSTYAERTGLLSDELRPGSGSLSNTVGVATVESTIDSRFLPGADQTVVLRTLQADVDSIFNKLQRTRNTARQARGALRAYAPLTPPALIGHTYAIEAYAEVLLADGYCSGIPLSTLDFDGDYTLRPGSSTEEVYRHAIVLLDSAITLSADSTRIRDFARVAKARALVAVADYVAAAAVVADIPTGFKYELDYSASAAFSNAFRYSGLVATKARFRFSVSDGEGITGGTGIKYVSLNDPRARVIAYVATGDPAPYPLRRAAKYDTAGNTPIVLASGIEAQLIQAEAELNNGGPWLATLNALRASGSVPGLSPLSDPGTRPAQVKLLFEERALWLFLTGTRQGDMRRMIRSYNVPASDLYATGNYYLQNAAGRYGPSVNFPTPLDERLSNPLYRGCTNRDA